MNETCIVSVPAEDREDLAALIDRLPIEEDFGEHRYFDGAVYVEALVPLVSLTSAAWLTLRTWIKARAEVQKAMRVTCRGVEITAMNRKDAERIIRLLGDAVTLDDDEDI